HDSKWKLSGSHGFLYHGELTLDHLRRTERIFQRVLLHKIRRPAGGFRYPSLRIANTDRDELAVVHVHSVVAMEAGDIVELGHEIAIDPLLELFDVVLVKPASF